MKLNYFLLAGAFVSLNSFAGDTFNTTIKGVDFFDCYSDAKTCVTIVTNGPLSTPCDGLSWRTNKEYVLESGEQGYKEKVAAILSSYHSQTSISFIGKGVCGMGDAERLSGFRVNG